MSDGVLIHTHCTHPTARLASIVAKCSDCCSVNLNGREHEGYVPRDLGIGGGDYVEFRWCLDCGAIMGEWPKHPELESEGEPDDDCDCVINDCGAEDPDCNCECHSEE